MSNILSLQRLEGADVVSACTQNSNNSCQSHASCNSGTSHAAGVLNPIDVGGGGVGVSPIGGGGGFSPVG